MHTAVKFAKVRPTAKIPYKRDEDMGFDIYADFEEDYILIHPHETKLIPTGIASACDREYGFILKERGSTGTKGMAQRSGVIDSGYRGEWLVPITNTSSHPLFIIKEGKDINMIIDTEYIKYPYEKAIAQALLIRVPTVDIEEYTYQELCEIPSERGTGKLGSSGK